MREFMMKTKFALIRIMKWFFFSYKWQFYVKGTQVEIQIDISDIRWTRNDIFMFCVTDLLLLEKTPAISKNSCYTWKMSTDMMKSDSWSYMVVRCVWMAKKERRKWRWARFFHPFLSKSPYYTWKLENEQDMIKSDRHP